MSYQSKNAEILALLTAAGKDIPTEDSDMGRAVQILQVICDSQSHKIPECTYEQVLSLEANQNAASEDAYNIFEALEDIESHIGRSDFNLNFEGNEYRIISESDIWTIYRDTIEEIVEDCYDLKLDQVPDFVALSIDWEQTAKNAYADGYGHTFSSYDGSEEEAAGYYIFRTN